MRVCAAGTTAMSWMDSVRVFTPAAFAFRRASDLRATLDPVSKKPLAMATERRARTSALKHSQYFFRHADFLQWQPDAWAVSLTFARKAFGFFSSVAKVLFNFNHSFIFK